MYLAQKWQGGHTQHVPRPNPSFFHAGVEQGLLCAQPNALRNARANTLNNIRKTTHTHTSFRMLSPIPIGWDVLVGSFGVTHSAGLDTKLEQGPLHF